MMKTVLVLPDGREISSGPGAETAIQSCTYTQSVNAGTQLMPGAVCAAMAELKLWAPGGVAVAAGDRFTLWKETDSRRKVGLFIVQSVERPSRNTVKITGCDPVILLEKDISAYLATVTWPCTLRQLAAGVLAACGVTWKENTLPGGSFQVSGITAQAVTGRQVMGWIAQAAGRFCRTDENGSLEFAWYEALPGHLIDGADLPTEDTRHLCCQGSLELSGYDTAPIDGVCIRQSDRDAGVAYPNAGGNTCFITGNPLLTGDSAALTALAKTLYEQLRPVTYTPCSFTIPASLDIRAGHILSLRDQAGSIHTVYLMERRQTGTRDTFTCTGSPRRDSPSAVWQDRYQALGGKVMALQADVDGIRVENKAADGRLTAVELDVDGLRTQVQTDSTDLGTLRREVSRIDQSARQVQISVETLEQNGASKVKTATGYTFDGQGLRIEKEGELIGNRLDNSGMYVTRAGQALLTANADGVTAADIRVKNYLVMGQNARLEDYDSGRTACFYIGG